MQSQNRRDPNYLLQINAFHRWLDLYYLPTNARLLWFMLIGLCNACGWAEWFQLDTLRMMAMLGVQSQNAAFRARDALVDAGLLEYQKGGKGRPNRYRLLFFPCKEGNASGSISESISGSISEGISGSISECISEGKANGINKHRHKQNQTKERGYAGEADAQERERVDYARVTELFNRICTSLPQVQTLNDKRRQAIRAASGTVEDFGGWEKLFETVQRSDFLTGRSGAWSGCGFDWILKSANLIKIIEGNYNDAAKQTDSPADCGGMHIGTVL